MDDQIKQAISNEKPTLLIFSTIWCGPCKQLKPIINELQNEMPNISFCIFDISNDMSIGAKFKISGVPYMILFKSGKELGRLLGYNHKHKIVDFITKSLL